MWVVAGVLSFFGALAYAELGAMMPATGGQYVFLEKAYGGACAFHHLRSIEWYRYFRKLRPRLLLPFKHPTM